jgi:hypothetical protein
VEQASFASPTTPRFPGLLLFQPFQEAGFRLKAAMTDAANL